MANLNGACVKNLWSVSCYHKRKIKANVEFSVGVGFFFCSLTFQFCPLDGIEIKIVRLFRF